MQANSSFRRLINTNGSAVGDDDGDALGAKTGATDGLDNGGASDGLDGNSFGALVGTVKSDGTSDVKGDDVGAKVG